MEVIPISEWLTKTTMKHINISHYGQTQNPLIHIQRNVRGYAIASQKKGICKRELFRV